ncbi:ribbon-helix-helix protein, CopG family [Mesorhizobium sp. Cs1321R2N1]|uniref:ribbon-helix-helix protein, CopG family n=1 Tax=Mesorhizobium sp. Cs1321R2N1 TaxID=3015174 RepID=UPI00301D776B
MDEQTLIAKKKRGPKPTGIGAPVMVRLHPDLLEALDRFIAESGSDLSRPEALRTAFREWSSERGYLGRAE